MRVRLRQLGRHRCGSRNEYKAFRNEYYHVCRSKRREWTLNRMRVLEHVCTSDRKLLWTQVDRLLNLSTRPPLPISVQKLHEYYFGVFHKPGSPTDITLCQNNHAHKPHTLDFKDKPPVANTCLVDTPSLTPYRTQQL